LTQRAFGHLGARASADNDLWLPAPDTEAALGRLLAAGFRPSAHVDASRALRERGQVALWPDGDPSRVSVDLHARPFARPYFDVDEQVLLDHLEEEASQGRPIRTFDRSLAFCHSVAHYVQHHLPDAQLEMIGRLWGGRALELSAADPALVALIDATCGRAAATLALHRRAQLLGPGGARGPKERRAREVARLLSLFAGAPPGVLRKLAALYLTAPERLLPGIRDSAFPPLDLLRERYGLGPRPWLLLRHVLRVLGER